MSRARAFADLATASEENSLSNRNMIINGDMAVAQRATSVTSSTGSGFKTVDRFQFVEGADAVITQAQSSDAPTSEGFSTSFKIDTTTADTSLASTQYGSINTVLEGLHLQNLCWGTSSAKPVTISFFIKSNLTGTFTLTLNANDATNRYQSQTYTINSANTWEKKSITFIGETTTAIPNDNTAGLFIEWGFASGTGYTSGGATGQAWSSDVTTYFGGLNQNLFGHTDNEVLLTGVQMEVGEVATPFKHESFADSLQKCQRYFAKSYSIGTAPAENAEIGYTYTAVSLSGTDVRVPFVTFPVRMRAAATVQFDEPAYPLTGGSAGQWHYGGVDQYDTPSASIQRDNGFYCSATVAGASTNSSHWTSGEWTADAEL